MINKQIIVTSANKQVNKSKLLGHNNMSTLYIFNMLDYYLDFSRNRTGFGDIFKKLTKLQYGLKQKNSDIICNYKSVLPKTYTQEDVDNNFPTNPVVTIPTMTSFSVSAVEEDLFNDGFTPPAYVYRFLPSDFLANYTDDNDGTFYSLVLDRSNLYEGTLRYQFSPTQATTWGESPSPLEISMSILDKWLFYTRSETIFEHPLPFYVRDKNGQIYTNSNNAIITIDRTEFENQPATIGDNTIIVDNNIITELTLAMFTSDLTPPYNDPENDLIDAIRITEISTANQGVFKLNGVEIAEGQIITRENMIAGSFTHEGAEVDTISSDTFSFMARDEGSQIWVN
jgi:hypothetical protein